MSLQFDGSDDVATEDYGSNVDPASGLTICVRAKPAALGATNVFVMFEDNQSTCLDVIQLFMNSSNQLDCRFRKAGSSTNLGNQTGTFADTTNFVPCILTVDATNCTLYKGSTSGAAGAHGQGSGSACRRIALGVNTLSSATRVAFYANQVCDVGIFPRKWSATEIGHYITDTWTAVKIENAAANNSMILYPLEATSGASSGMLNAGCHNAGLTKTGTATTADAAGLSFPTTGTLMKPKGMGGGMSVLDGGMNS